MPLKKFDPWQCLHETNSHAYSAYPAYSVPGIGSLGMLGMAVHTLIGDFEERAAILEMTGGHSRHDAEHIAATAAGHGSVTELRAAAIGHWRHLLNVANDRSAGPSPLIANALTLVASPWIGQLVALGWDEVSIFGCDPAGREIVGFLAATSTTSIVAVTTNSVRYRDVHGVARHYYRFPITTCGVHLIWELDGLAERSRTSANAAKPMAP